MDHQPGLLSSEALSQPLLWTVATVVFLFAVANFLALMLIVRKLPRQRQLGFVAFGVVFGACIRLGWLVWGLFEWKQQLLLVLLGFHLMFLSFSTVPSFRQAAMPTYKAKDFWIATFWIVVVNIGFTQLSALSNLGIALDMNMALAGSAIGYGSALLFSGLLYLYAEKIRGLVVASCWVLGLCGVRMIIEGFDADHRWDFRSLSSYATLAFWSAFTLGIVGSLFVKCRRDFQLPMNHSGKASFLLRR